MRYSQLKPVLVGLALCIAGALTGLAYFAFAQPKYMARMTIGPVDSSDSSQKIPGSLGVLAGLAGASGDTSDTYSQFLFQLTSYETAARLLSDRKITDALEARKKLSRPFSADDIHGYVNDTLKFDKPRGGLLDKSPLTILTVKDKDPRFAGYFLTRVVAESDGLVKNRRMAELGGRRDKVVETLESVTTAEYREALIRLLAQVERERLISDVDRNYAFRVVDSLVESAKPVDPRLMFSIGIGFFIGFVVAAIFLVLWFLRITVVRPRDA